jgi:hypothetical protein
VTEVSGVIETVSIVQPWLYDVLTGDSALVDMVGEDISGALSPEALTPPFVSFLLDSGVDVLTGAGASRISVNTLYLVKAVAATTSWDDVGPIASRIDTLLHLPYQVVTLDNGSLSSIRERIVQYPEVQDGIAYLHLGALYRIRVSADV